MTGEGRREVALRAMNRHPVTTAVATVAGVLAAAPAATAPANRAGTTNVFRAATAHPTATAPGARAANRRTVAPTGRIGGRLEAAITRSKAAAAHRTSPPNRSIPCT